MGGTHADVNDGAGQENSAECRWTDGERLMPMGAGQFVAITSERCWAALNESHVACAFGSDAGGAFGGAGAGA